MAITSHNIPGLPKQTRAAKRAGILSAAVWNELHDFLTLALDALGERPEDFDETFLRNCVMHQRLALRITHATLERFK